MGLLLKRNPDFPDLLPMGSGYEGLQRREMQSREVDVTRKLVGYVPTIFTDGDGNRWEVYARPIGGAPVSQKWRLVAVGTNQFRLILGRVRDGSDDITINNASMTFSPSSSDCVYLERDGGVPTGDWDLELKAGAFSEIWKFDGTDGDSMIKYRKKLITFHGSQPSFGAVQIGQDLWAEYHSAPADLAAITTVVKNPSNNKAVSVIELVPD